MPKHHYLHTNEIISYDGNLYIVKEDTSTGAVCHKCALRNCNDCTLDSSKLSGWLKNYKRCPCSAFSYLVLIPGGKNA